MQFSATSQTPADDRHTVDDDTKPSVGQPSFTPSHDSSTSHAPAELRQTPVLFASSGHVLLVPSHVSSESQTPALDRQTVPASSIRSTHAPLPSHVSGASHAVSLDDPHAVPSAASV